MIFRVTCEKRRVERAKIQEKFIFYCLYGLEAGKNQKQSNNTPMEAQWGEEV
jgi:hypothetical protein